MKDKPQPIGVLSLNPAVDMSYEIPRLLADQKVHAVATRFDPGGNGINVGRALQRLDITAKNYCITAGEIGRLLKHLLSDQLGEVDFEEVTGETRINGTLIESTPRLQYEVSGLGPEIAPAQLNRLLARFVEHSAGGVGVLTGSLQQTLSPMLYAGLARDIGGRGGRAVVDSHDEALRYAIDASPFLIKPNRYELEMLLGRSLKDIVAVAREARTLQLRGVEYVCVSLDGEGALLVGPENSYHAGAPKVNVLSSVGACDSMVAALVAAFAVDADPQTALRLSIACAAGTVCQPGTELFSVDDIDLYFDDIVVQNLDI